jgi:3-oxoacyl-[acyl-carrier protein] reductase
LASLAIAGQYPVKAVGIQADVSTVSVIDRVLDRLQAEFGTANILINNAGTGSNKNIMQAPDDKWQYYWDLHVIAAVRLVRFLVPGMLSRGGDVILQNASICAKQPLGSEPIYNVTKTALMVFSKCLANELEGAIYA